VVLGVFDLLHLPFDERIAALSMAGLVVVAIAELRPSAIAGHLAAIGFIVELSALGASNPGWTRVLALAALAIALGLVAVLQELQGSSFVALLARAVRPIRLTPVAAALPAVGLVITMPFLVVDLGGQLGVLTGRRSLAGLALAMTALGYAAAARLLRKRQPIAAIAATSAVLLSGVGIAVAAPDLWPVIIAVAVSIAIVLVIGGDLRRSFMTWFAWLMSIVLVILVADAVSVPAGSLHLVLLGVGAGYVVGGLLYDDVASGRRLVGEGLRQSWLMPPVALGSLAVPAALAFTFPHGASSFGWWSIAAALFYLVVAVQLRSGAVSSASYALAAFGLSVVSPWHLLDRPWLLLPVAAILVALSAAIRRLHPGARDLTSRWDLAPLLVAHIVGGVALARAVGLDSVAPTWSAFGGLCLVVAAWRRHWAWAATGLVLLLVGAQAAGPGWLALALIVTAGVTAVIAQRSAGVLRIAMQAGTMIAGGSAWLSALVWRSASVDAAVATTAMAFGATWLLVALLGRRRLKPDWLTAAGALATIGVAAASATGITLGQQRHPFALLVAGGFALHAAGTALAARPLRWSFLRELAMLILTVAVGSAIFDLQPSLTISGAFLAVLSAVAFGGALVLSRLRMPSDWLRPLLLFGGLMSAGAMGYGVSALPLRGLLIATLLLLAVEAASVSLILRRTEPMYLVPVFACGAWLAFATDALAGNPDWLTVPIGLTALAIVELFRRDRRAARIAINSPELIVLEYAGMLFVVGASLVQTVSQSVLYGLLAMALGIGLAAWGFMTRVKRRIEVGAGAVAIAAVLMVSVPVVRIIPQFQGAALWAALAAIGIVLLLVATMLEQGRSAVRRTYRRFEELMLGWE
jgi:hypothetical protein